MNKIVEALKKLLPEDHLKEVSSAVEEMLEESKKEIEESKETEFNKKLEEAYSELTGELASAEKIAEQGYEEAFAIITDLRNRLEIQREEFEKTLDEGYEEAYQMLLAERAKNSSIEVGLYEEYDKKYSEQKEYFIEMIDKFLLTKGPELHEQIRRDLVNDSRYAEHKVALDKIADILSGYLTNEDISLATGTKLEDASRQIEEQKAQIKLIEARNVRLSMDKTKLEEAVRHNNEVITESKKNEKNDKIKKAQNVSGRGNIVAEADTKIIAENNNESASAKDTNKSSVLVESLGMDRDTLSTLAGTVKSK
jgi:hypothetical protein